MSDEDLDDLTIEHEYPIDPDDLFEFWITPRLLQLWWPASAQVEAEADGSYEFSWPQMDWVLRGEYTEFDPPDLLAFTWKWDHEDVPERLVTVDFEQTDEGTLLTVRHGSYTLEDEEERNEHSDGWLHFLDRLESAVADHHSAS